VDLYDAMEKKAQQQVSILQCGKGMVFISKEQKLLLSAYKSVFGVNLVM